MKEIKKIANSRIPLEKRIDLTVDKSGVNKGIIMKSFIKQLLKCHLWDKTNYKNVSYYGVYVQSDFKEPKKLFIVMPFNDEMLDIVKNGCRWGYYPRFECVKQDDSHYVIRDTYIFKDRTERDVFIYDVKKILKILGLSGICGL